MYIDRIRCAAIVVLMTVCTACATQQRNIHSSAVEYLYSGGYEGGPATLVKLQTPVRVGIAFAPIGGGVGDAFPEEKKQQLMKQIADAFRTQPKIAAIEIVPSSYLNPRGGFDELDRLRAALRISEIVLISYDQVQFSDTGAMGLTYWAYGVPAYVVKGEKNETRTFLDAVVLDIPARAMLFHAAGQSSIKGSSTLVGVNKALRERSAAGFEEAVKDLIENLDKNLRTFETSVKDGTIAVDATPKIPAWNPAASGAALTNTPTPGASGRGGSDVAMGALLVALVVIARRRVSRARVGSQRS